MKILLEKNDIPLGNIFLKIELRLFRTNCSCPAFGETCELEFFDPDPTDIRGNFFFRLRMSFPFPLKLRFPTVMLVLSMGIARIVT